MSRSPVRSVTRNPQQRLILAIAITASFVAFLDMSVVTVALPSIVDQLGGGLTTQQWTVDAYLLTLGSLILVAGSVSDAFGRQRVLRIGLILFGIASLAIAAAPTSDVLIAARLVQGVGGGGGRCWCRPRWHSSCLPSTEPNAAAPSAPGPPRHRVP